MQKDNGGDAKRSVTGLIFETVAEISERTTGCILSSVAFLSGCDGGCWLSAGWGKLTVLLPVLSG